MNSNTVIPVLIAGGSGSRLWPVSRQSYPKQFVDLLGDGDSLYRAALRRRSSLEIDCPWIVVGSEDHRFVLAQQAAETGVALDTIILEPEGRNTAPAIALAALRALEICSDAKLFIQTADHLIKDHSQLQQSFQRAVDTDSSVCLFGIEPTRPETGFGYLKIDATSEHSLNVTSFVEKPTQDRAQEYIDSGCYLWNSGMFLIDAHVYLDLLAKYEPQVMSAVEFAWRGKTVDRDFLRVDPDKFRESPSISVDYAVMERMDRPQAVRYSGDWDDLGSWDAVFNHLSRDDQGNVSSGNTFLSECKETHVYSDGRVIAGLGLEDVCIVDTPDALLVARTSHLQDVKSVVKQLQSAGRLEASSHKKVYRPWGSYETLALASNFQVKQIEVNPGASLSLQLHHHRAEHWVVVSGSALVEVSDSQTLLSVNESIYIPIGEKHRLANPGKIPVKLIEVQSGQYLGEDDIVRFDDEYGRS